MSLVEPVRHFAAPALPLLAPAILFVAVSTAHAGRLLVEWDGRTQELQTIEVSGTDLVALADVARVFRFELLRDGRREATIRRQEGAISLRAGRAIVDVGTQPVLLRSEVRRKGGELYVPVDFIPRAVARLLDTEARLDESQSLIRFDTLTEVLSCEEYADRVRVTLQLRRAAELSEVVRDGRRRILVITNQELPAQVGGCRFNETLADLELRPTAGQTRVTFFVGPRFASLKVYDLPDSRQLVFDFFNDASTEPRIAEAEPRVAHPHDVFDTVVIDPGHGGEDTGAVGPAGLAEKTLVLAVAQELARRLREAGLDVIMTRTGDDNVALDERTAIANRAQADLFLSLHAHAALQPDARGAETYVHSVDATGLDRRTGSAFEEDASSLRRANRGGRGEQAGDELELVLWDVAQQQFRNESSWLGEAVQRELDALAGTGDRGVRQASLAVLRGAMMPATLVEVGNLENPQEERAMAELAFREATAQALLRAVTSFRDELAARSGR